MWSRRTYKTVGFISEHKYFSLLYANTHMRLFSSCTNKIVISLCAQNIFFENSNKKNSKYDTYGTYYSGKYSARIQPASRGVNRGA